MDAIEKLRKSKKRRLGGSHLCWCEYFLNTSNGFVNYFFLGGACSSVPKGRCMLEDAEEQRTARPGGRHDPLSINQDAANKSKQTAAAATKDSAAAQPAASKSSDVLAASQTQGRRGARRLVVCRLGSALSNQGAAGPTHTLAALTLNPTLWLRAQGLAWHVRRPRPPAARSVPQTHAPKHAGHPTPLKC